jgi:glycosyltransferase involved in cell wall biosynthesis
MLRVPLIVEVNELAGDERVRPDPVLAWCARAADRVTMRLASRIVVVSPHLRRRIIALGVPAARVLVLPNAVSVGSLEAPVDGAAIRARHHASDAIVIGFVGWFVPWHRLDRLIEQFAALAAGKSRLRLMLVGEGTLRPDLTALAARLGISGRLIWTGSVPHANVPAHIAAMDICVVPHSNVYRSPIKLFEYMGRGRAVVAPRTEPIEAVVRHGDNGLLFDPGDAADLRAQLARLGNDPDLCDRLGQAARETVRARHTWLENARAVLGSSQ